MQYKKNYLRKKRKQQCYQTVKYSSSQYQDKQGNVNKIIKMQKCSFNQTTRLNLSNNKIIRPINLLKIQYNIR